jgi:hypothetical protein
MTPSVSFSWRPDFSKEWWGYYRSVQKDSLGNMETYSIYNGGSNAWAGIYGSPPSGKYGALVFSLGNNFEMKVRAPRDTANQVKKITLLENLSLGSTYNMAVDTLKWSDISVQGRTNIFRTINVSFGAGLDPYYYDSLGRSVNVSEYKAAGKLARLTRANISLGMSFRSKEKGKQAAKSAELAGLPPDYLRSYVDFKVPWSLSINYGLNYTVTTWNSEHHKFDDKTTKTLNFSGDVNLTSKWKIGFSSGYDFETKDFTYTSVNIYRDLHCWEMSFSWIPFGFYQSYNFHLNVKASVLQDLKLNKRKNWTENF